MHLLLTRPEAEPGDDALAAGLAAAGHQVLHAPMLSVVTTGVQPSFEGAQGLIATSRNGLNALSGRTLPDEVLSLPLFAVGPATAALARKLGFRDVIEGAGTGRALVEAIRREAKAEAGVLVHLAGEALAFDLEAALAPLGYRVRVETLYRTEPAGALPSAARDALASGAIDGVVLMSPRTAMVYARLTLAAGIFPRPGGPLHFCLSEAVARELSPLGDVRLAVARSPNSQEMLALIAREAPDSA